MNVFVAMAIAALFFGLTKLRPFRMTVAAFCLLMRAVEREVSKRMIEGNGIELNDLRITAFMFLMTGKASGIQGLGLQAMKTSCAVSIVLHIRMTTSTQNILAGAVVRGVTAVAAFFDARMRLDDGPRHNEPLDIKGLRLRAICHQRTHE